MLNTLSPWLLLGLVVAVIAVIVGAVRFLRWNRSTPRQIQRVVRSISVDALVDVVIPDGVDGEIHIDHLLLTEQGLLVLDIKDVRGSVFAGDKMDVWTAIEPGNRFTFDNPIPLMQDRVAAVAWQAPGVPIESKVVFTQNAEFPKGHPDAVITLDALYEQYRCDSTEIRGPSMDGVASQWDRIKAVATAA